MDCSSYWTIPTSTIFLSGIWLHCRGGSENPPPGKPPHSAVTNTCFLCIYPHLAHFLSVYGIISRCSIGRIQADSDSSFDTSWFWSASRICSDLTVQRSFGMFENHYGLKRDRTHDRIFTRILRFLNVFPSGNTSVTLYY